MYPRQSRAVKFAYLYELSDRELKLTHDDPLTDANTRRAISRVRNLRKDPYFYSKDTVAQRRARAVNFALGNTGAYIRAISNAMYHAKHEEEQVSATLPEDLAESRFAEELELVKAATVAKIAAKELDALLRKRYCKARKENSDE